MKRIGLTAILLCCLLGMTSCQKEESAPTASSSPHAASTVFSSAPTSTQTPTPEPTAEPTPITLENGEIDLTQMSSTMVYSYIFNLMYDPTPFIGKRFCIQGIYDENYWAENDTTYHCILIPDAAACCAQGIEFVLTDENASYPQPADDIEINGILTTYIEDDTPYIEIQVDQIEIL